MPRLKYAELSVRCRVFGDRQWHLFLTRHPASPTVHVCLMKHPGRWHKHGFPFLASPQQYAIFTGKARRSRGVRGASAAVSPNTHNLKRNIPPLIFLAAGPTLPHKVPAPPGEHIEATTCSCCVIVQPHLRWNSRQNLDILAAS